MNANTCQDIHVKMAAVPGLAVPNTAKVKEMSDFLEEKVKRKDRWSCATMVFGVEYVTQAGVPAQHHLFAVTLDTLHYVRMFVKKHTTLFELSMNTRILCKLNVLIRGVGRCF